MRSFPALDLTGEIRVEGDAHFTIELEGRTMAIVHPSIRQLVYFARNHRIIVNQLRITQLQSLLNMSDVMLELRVKDAVVGRMNGSMKGNWLAKLMRLGPIQIDFLGLLKSLR